MCRLSRPYVQGPSGWGVSTAKQEHFCEMHYYMTPYMAEFINTVSNLAYFYFSVYGIRKMSRSRYDTCIFWSYVSLAGVGLGSTAFHASFKYPGQIADEVSMLYATATIAYAVFSINRDAKGRTLLAVLLALIVVTITAIHIYRGESTVFQILWGSMVFSIFLRCKRVLASHVPAGKTSEQMAKLVTWGTVSFVGGFLLWNVDNIMCSRLLAFRSIVGMPWGFVTELHGWWHILTGLGVYHFIVFIHYLRVYVGVSESSPSAHDSKSGRQTGYELVWPRFSVLPYLTAVKRAGKRE